MVNTSASGGYLTPSSSAPAYDAELDRILQQMVVGITGLTGSLVRPRWQPVMPKQPDPSVDWCAIGVQTVEPDDGPAIVHDSTGDGSDTVVRHETVEIIASFYGPNGLGNAARLRDGMSVPQNGEALLSVGIQIVDTSAITPAPALVNEQWVRKYDMRLTFRRPIARVFPILNLLSAVGTIVPDMGPEQDFVVELDEQPVTPTPTDPVSNLAGWVDGTSLADGSTEQDGA